MISLRHAWVVAAVLSTFVLPGDGRAASGRDLPPSVLAWQVSIGGGPAEAYRSVTGIGVDVDVVRDPNTRPPSYRPGRKTWSPIRLVQPVGNVLVNGFDTDLARDAIKITFEPTVADTILTANADPKLPARPIPGATKIGKTTFTTTSSTFVVEWGRALAAGTATPRDITINVKNPAGAVQRTMVLKRSIITSYACDGAAAQVVVQPETMSIAGPANKALMDWVQAGLDGANGRRDARLSWVHPSTHVVLAGTTVKNAFVTEVAWGTLDGASTSPLVDTVTIQPESLDALP